MSLDPAIFRALVANGATPEQLLAVVEAAAAVEEEKRAAKRAGNARRQQEWRDRQKANAAESNGNNALRSVTERDGVTDPAPNKSPPDPQKLTPTPCTPTHEAPARRATVWACPEGVDPGHWRDFLANRRRKRCATTETALRGILADLARYSDPEWPPGRLVEQAAAKGWASIVDPHEHQGFQNGRRNGAPRTDGMGRDDGHGRTVDALLEWVGTPRH